MSSWMLFFTVIIAGAYAEDYCNLEICSIIGIPHTMCLYPSPEPSPACGIWHKIGLSDAEKQEVLDMHNEERRKVAAGRETRGNPGPQPAAVNIPEMTWDSELEMVAQRWANQCILHKHDGCPHVDRFLVGQNMAGKKSSIKGDLKFRDCVESWINEVNKFNRNDVYKLPLDFGETSHYTQMVTDQTNTIGCGQIIYEIPRSNMKGLSCVCNYGAIPGFPIRTPGNSPGQPLYATKE